MDIRRKEKIKLEIKKADEYIQASDILYANGLFSASVMTSYYAAIHATIGAFLTGGTQSAKEPVTGFASRLVKFSEKLDPFLKRLKEERVKWKISTSHEYSENEALLRLYQTRELVLEVKDFLRKTIK